MCVSYEKTEGLGTPHLGVYLVMHNFCITRITLFLHFAAQIILECQTPQKKKSITSEVSWSLIRGLLMKNPLKN